LSLLALVSCFAGCSGSDRKDFYTRLTENRGAKPEKPNEIYSIYLRRGRYDGKEFTFDNNNLKTSIQDTKITDADVLSFTNDIVDLLRKKSLTKRSIRLTPDALDFLAYAKWVSLNNTANSNAQANASRALESEIISELQAIFREYLDEAKLKCMEDALARHNKNSAKNGNTLTTEGNELLKDILNANSAPDPNQTKIALAKAINDLVRNTLGWKKVPITVNIDGTVSTLNSCNSADVQGSFYQWVKKMISFETECFGDFMNRIIDEKPWYRSP
jgi:hypothetical protein